MSNISFWIKWLTGSQKCRSVDTLPRAWYARVCEGVVHAFAEAILEDFVHELQHVDAYGVWLEEY